jgi:hypothetical protein
VEHRTPKLKTVNTAARRRANGCSFFADSLGRRNEDQGRQSIEPSSAPRPELSWAPSIVSPDGGVEVGRKGRRRRRRRRSRVFI